MMRAVVAGASSQIGVFLVPLLAKAGFETLAVSRNAPGGSGAVHGAVRWVQHPPPATEADTLVSCGPLDLALRFLRQFAPIRKAVVFSTTSLLTKRLSGNSGEREQIDEIAAGEAALRTLCAERNVDLAILRPTLVYGCGLDRNLSLLLRLGNRFGLIPLSSRAGGLRQPVHAEDLARLALDCLRSDTRSYFESAAPGGETVSYREMVSRVSACGNRPIRLLPLPPALLSGCVRLASAFGPWKGINPEMVRRQAVDLVFDPPGLPAAIPWNPRPFNPTSSDFHIPPELESYRL